MGEAWRFFFWRTARRRLVLIVALDAFLPPAEQLAVGMLGDLFSSDDFGSSTNGGGGGSGGKPGIILPEFRPTGKYIALV